MKRYARAIMMAVVVSGIGLSQARADWVTPQADSGCDSGNSGLFLPPTRSPQWLAARDGEPIDVVQFYLHGALSQLDRIFVGAGWTQALRNNIPDDVLYGGGVLLGIGWLIRRMPVSAEFFCGKKMLKAYELNNSPLGGRRHFRVYSAGEDAQGSPVWAISASRDTGIRFDHRRATQFFLTHVSEPDEDLERDRVLQNLVAADAVASLDTLDLAPTGYAPDNGAYSGDGEVYDIVLK